MNTLNSWDSKKNWWEVKVIILTTYKVHPTYSRGLLAFLHYFNSVWGEGEKMSFILQDSVVKNTKTVDVIAERLWILQNVAIWKQVLKWTNSLIN